jgi:hypothetical protein
MAMRKVQCKSCGAWVPVKKAYHGGRSDEGFLYCNKDSTVVTWFGYDPEYDSVTGAKKLPWILDEKERRSVEKHIIDCPCGGRFLFDTSPKCPICGGPFADPMLRSGWVVVLGRHIDGSKTKIWK